MNDFTQKHLNKELVNAIPEVLPPNYAEWLDIQKPTMSELEAMAMATQSFGDAMNNGFRKPVF